MGIREKRYEKALERIIKEELQEGNLPSSNELLWRITKYLEEKDINSPEFKYRPVKKGQTATAYWFNKDYEEISNDLNSLYENIIDLNNKLDSNLNKFDIEKEKIENNLNALENELKEKILLYSDNGLINTLFDTFDDSSKIDSINTTTEIDLKNHYVSIPTIKNTSRKIDPVATTSFSLTNSIKAIAERKVISGNTGMVLNEYEEEIWKEMYLLKEKAYVSGYFYIRLESVEKINQINISLQSVLPTDVKIEFTTDDVNWFSLPYHEEKRSILNEYVFNFPSAEMKEIRILLGKKDADDETLGEQYTNTKASQEYKYIFGIKHIGLYEMSYQKEAVFESNWLDASNDMSNFSINEVSLSTIEEVPQATSIEYSIAIREEGQEEAEEWFNLSTVEDKEPKYKQILNFKNVTSSKPISLSVSEEKSQSEFEMKELYANGINFYKIGSIEEDSIIEGTERLYVGKETWGVKKYYEKKEDGHIPTIEDWYENKDFLYEYLKMEDGLASNLLSVEKEKDYCNYMFKLGLLSEKEQIIETVIPISNEPIAIYVNGDIVYQGMPTSKSRATFSLSYGWNEIIILLYTDNKDQNQGTTLDIGIDLRDFSKNIYSQKEPLSKVDLHNLRYNVLANDRSSYSINESLGKKNIILNYLEPNLTYDFYFDYIEGNTVKEIKFRAILKKDEQQSIIAPKLKRYRLRFG